MIRAPLWMPLFLQTIDGILFFFFNQLFEEFFQTQRRLCCKGDFCDLITYDFSIFYNPFIIIEENLG